MGETSVTDRNIHFKPGFIAPKYWPTWLLFGLIALSSSLPRWFSCKIGDALGLSYRRINQKRRRIVDTNLRLCFPERSDTERAVIARDHFRFYGRSVIDFGLSWWASKRRLDQLIKFKNIEYYLDTIKDHNVILLLPHMIGLDCGITYASSLRPTISMMKTLDNELVNWRLWKGRTRFKPTRVVMRDQGLRPLVRGVKSGLACYYMPDEDFGESNLSVFAPFYGEQVSTLTTLSAMARLADAKVVPVYPIMLENGQYEVAFDVPLDSFPSGDALADATLINQMVERCISRAPAQYMWTLRWFKTRPDGAASPYL